MEDILYVKVEQNMVVQKKTLTYEDIATLYCQNQNIVKKLNKEIFYTLDPKQQKTMFTIEKVYQGIHKVYPGLRIENVGERDFIVDLEVPDGKEKSRTMQYIKTAVVCLVSFFGAAFTIMTFNEDVSVSKVFDHVYEFVMGVKALRWKCLMPSGCHWESWFFITISIGERSRMIRRRSR